MMSTAQLAANQANALRSTGPTTEEGKSRSSLNSLRHGLTAKTALLPTEDPEAYRKHCQIYFQRFAHRDAIERQFVQQLADVQWRLLRISGLEAALLDNLDIKGLATLAIYEQRLLRTFEKTLAVLKKLQASASKEEVRDGFVYSTPPKPKLFCDLCSTQSDSGKRCEKCGQRDYLINEIEYERRHPYNAEFWDNPAVAEFVAQTSAGRDQQSAPAETAKQGMPPAATA